MTSTSVQIDAISNGNVDFVKDWLENSPNDLNKAIIDSVGQTALHLACIAKQSKIVDELLKKDSIELDVVDSTDKKWTPLHYAAESGDVDIVDKLLQKKKKMVEGSTEDTPVHVAARLGHKKVLEAMIKKYPNCKDARGKDDRSPLHEAVEHGQFSTASLLIDKGAKLGLEDGVGDTPVHLAVRHDREEILKKMVQKSKKCVSCQGHKNRRPLHEAAQRGQLSIAIILMSNGAKLDDRDDSQDTPFHWAARCGHKEILNRMIEKRKPNLINDPGSRKRTPLHRAAEFGHVSTATLLIEKKAKLKSKDDVGDSPAHLAARNGHTDVLKVIIKKDSSCKDVVGSDKKTPLHESAEHGQLSTASLLIDEGANLKAKDELGDTPVHWAARRGHKSVLEKMIEKDYHNKDILAGDEKTIYYTPLHKAAQYDQVATAALLMDKGSSLNAKDDLKDTPVHWAARYGSARVLKEMIKRFPDCVHFCGYNNETPLHHAAKDGHLDAVRVILSFTTEPTVHKKYVNNRSEDDEMPLHFAAQNGSMEIVKLLCEEYGANVNPTQSNKKYRKSPFHKAVFYQNTDIAMYLLGRKAEVTSASFRDIVSEGFEKLAKAVIETDQWPLALRGTYKRYGGRTETTAFRELIKEMPDVAEMVLTKCILIESKSKDGKSNKQKPKSKDGKSNKKTLTNDTSTYNVIYNYEFIEDYEDGLISQTEQSEDKEKHIHKSSVFGFAYDDVDGSTAPPTWPGKRLKDFSKNTHPLKIMVDFNRMNLLSHPVVSSFIHYKWLKFGLKTYLFNLFTFILYLSLLTSFALTVPNPQSEQCRVDNIQLNSTELGQQCSFDGTAVALSIVVLCFAILRLLFEVLQLINQRESYFLDVTNYFEVPQYIFTMIFVPIYGNDCSCVKLWQWEVGVVAVFLGWVVMILFVRKIPFIGIYVLILLKILATFLKFTGLAILLVVGFGISFYMIFFDFQVTRSPFVDVGRSLLKTITMTTGEFDYDAIFRLDPAGESDESEEIKYPHISFILWIVFIILMPLILNNMLISLAVDVTKDVLEVAKLKTLALQVDQILTVQSFLMFIRRRLLKTKNWRFLNKHFQKVKVKRRVDSVKVRRSDVGYILFFEAKRRKLRAWLKHHMWNGSHYDYSTVVNKYIQPTKTELEEKVDGIANELKILKVTLQSKERVEDHSVQTPPLLAACKGGHTEIASWLIEETGADVNETDSLGRTPLLAACEGGHTKCVRLLVGKNADMNKQAQDGTSPLLAACKGGHTEAVQLLINKSEVDVNESDNNGISPLHAACEGGHFNIVEALINKRVDMERGDKFGTSPLLAVCEGGDTGVDSEAANCRERTEIAQLLIEAGVDVNKVNKFGRTALLAACERGHKGIARLLINCTKRQDVVKTAAASTETTV